MLSQTMSTPGYRELTYRSITHTGGTQWCIVRMLSLWKETEQYRLFLWTVEWKGWTGISGFALLRLTETLVFCGRDSPSLFGCPQVEFVRLNRVHFKERCRFNPREEWLLLPQVHCFHTVGDWVFLLLTTHLTPATWENGERAIIVPANERNEGAYSISIKTLLLSPVH